MANLKEVRNRIASVNSTQQITKAMKMVSAAKLRRAQDAIIMMRPYAAKLREIMENISGSLDGNTGGQFAAVRPVQKVLIIAVNSNRGLCGAFNANITRTVNRMIRENYAAQAKSGNVKVLCIGKKASDFFSKLPAVYAGQHNDVYSNLAFENVAKVAEVVMTQFAAGEYDKVEVVYNQFKNAAVQNVMVEQVLPIAPAASGKEKKQNNDYIFEPAKEELVLELIPKSIKIQIYKAVLDSHASEHGARMTAMSKATDNAGELLKDLRLSYNKARQAAITGEILEIVAGAEALNG
ncbi:MAG: ATP synthase F1 subunit gamma [Bacteroidetes bacterium]|nr:ATP synthase F1 subunit gamma [Bacteroidota bacterium]